MRANHLKTVLITGLALSGLASASASAASAPTGVWIDHTSRGAVEIKDCGDGNLCGHVVWTKETADSKGCGLQILGNVKPVGGNQWDNGWIYSPEKKQKFSVELTPLDGNRLRVKGYKGIKLLSKTMIWHRASSALERCDSTTADNKSPVAKPRVTAKAKDPAQQDSATATTTARVTKPRVLNSEPSQDRAAATPSTPQRTAKATPAQTPDQGDTFRAEPSQSEDQARNREGDGASIYADPSQKRNDNNPRFRDDDRDDERLNGLANLVKEFGTDGAIEVGDRYGIKLEDGPDGEKNCRLDVPFVTVNIPCED